MNDTHEIKPPSSINSRWLSIRLEENEAALWQVENMTVYAQRILGDWMLARAQGEEGPSIQQAQKTHFLPINLQWKRWALEHPTNEIRFWPCFPDKPIVVKTRVPVIVPPKTTVDLFVNLPIWLEVSVAQQNQFYTLDTLVPTTLSNTWYGTHFEGQLCYALRSRARRSINDLTYEPLRAICQMKIRNRSSQSLPVEKIRILTEFLSIYRSGEKLWANTLDVTFKGEEVPAELNYSNTIPIEAGPGELIRKSSSPISRGSIIDRLFLRNHDSDEK